MVDFAIAVGRGPHLKGDGAVLEMVKVVVDQVGVGRRVAVWEKVFVEGHKFVAMQLPGWAFLDEGGRGGGEVWRNGESVTRQPPRQTRLKALYIRDSSRRWKCVS